MSRCLHFNKKDFLVAQIPSGEILGFYRQHRPDKSKAGWMPHEGLVFCSGKSVPLTPNTQRFWRGAEEFPGHGTREIQNFCKELDSQNLPVGEPATPLEVNELFPEEISEELNGRLNSIDEIRKATDQTPLRLEEKSPLPLENEAPQKAGLIDSLNRLVKTLLKVGTKRIAGHNSPLIPARTLLIAALVLPIAMTSAKAGPEEREKAANAYSVLQELSGKEIKEILKAIPEDQRINLVELLPKGVMSTGILPAALAAKLVAAAPETEIKKGFTRMTKEQFQTAAEKVDPATLTKLVSLVKDAAQKANISQDKTATLAMK